MTKNDIADHLCKSLDFRRSEAIHAIDEVFNFLADSFSNAQNVYIRGFGTFEIQFVKEKKARNICKGTTVIVPACKTVKLRLCKELKNKINQ